VDKEGVKMQKQAEDLERGISDLVSALDCIMADLAKRGIVIKVPGNAVSESMGDERQ
jgi:hypothetical protein